MKSTQLSIRISMLLAVAILLNVGACRKKEDLDNDTNASKNESIAERYFNELQDLSDQAAKTGDLSTFKLSSNEGTITWNATRTRTWIEGYNTLVFVDDVYSITGAGSGTKVNGQSWTSLITSPLVHKRICHQIVSGVLQVTPSNKPIRTIDFGQGNCDNTLTVLINGNTYTVTF